MVNIHSISYTITNSSSELFISANALEFLKLFIDQILKDSDSELTCDDLYDIEIVEDQTPYGRDIYSVNSCYRSKKYNFKPKTDSNYKMLELVNDLFEVYED